MYFSGDNLTAVPGQVVHPECRKNYCHPNIQRQNTEKDAEHNISSPRTRKCGERFDFKTKCLLCGKDAKSNLYKRGEDVWPITTLPFIDNLKETCNKRQDDWGRTVLGRLEYAQDLPAVEAKYHNACLTNFNSGYQVPKRHMSEDGQATSSKRGRQSKSNVEEAFLETVEYFEDNERCQMTVSDLVDKMSEICGEEAYSVIHMKRKIIEHFGDSIIISELNGKHNVVTFKDSADAILHDFYRRNVIGNKESETKMIIRTAAKLISSDIKDIQTNKEEYPSSNDIMSMDSNMECIPENLRLFLKHVIDIKSSERKVASIGQAIVQASAPRSVIEPLQLGLGVQLHHHFGSRYLIDLLNSLGFCCPYREVQRFERSAAATQVTEIAKSDEHFLQFVADNVDHNISTLDGHNTFHGMGIIATVTPKLEYKTVIPRVTATNEDLIAVGKIEISYYKHGDINMDKLVFAKLNSEKAGIHSCKYEDLDFVVKVARPLRPSTPGWSGMMQMVQTGEFPGQSSVIFMPMIDMNPSDMSCIYSTLKFVAKQSDKLQVTPVITFDQPLYWKAYTIVFSEPENSDLKCIVVRLGAFHTEMSFLGAIGKLMENSGLSELLATVYAPNTTGHMLSGKAISRAVRGHLLVNDALSNILLRKAGLETDIKDKETSDTNNNNVEDITDEPSADIGSSAKGLDSIKAVIDKFIVREITFENVMENDAIAKVKQRYELVKESLKQHRTAKLWLQYLEMTDILKKFIAAERMGDWLGHLSAMQEMLPYFAASGHNLYLKSGYVYLQEMASLSEKSPDVYTAFCNGNHVVRRSDRFWGGLSSDLVIEQVLMRSVKSVGGLTRGRGMTESQRAQWLLSMPACVEINNAMQEFTGHRVESSDQHKESKEARIERDTNDRKVFEEFLQERNPFTEESSLRNIETGAVADAKVNADDARVIGQNIIEGMEGSNVVNFTFKRAQQAITMGSKSNVKVGGEEISIDPQLLFQGLISVSDDSMDDTEDLFRYELCSNPSALFDSSGLLREAQKSSLGTAIWAQGDCSSNERFENVIYVLDGGSLLHRTPWSFGSTFQQICKEYTNLVERNYGKCHVVFDGYQNGPSIKDVTHQRRTKGLTGTKINFNENTPFKTKKDVFLSNNENKQNFINMLGKVLSEKGCSVVYAEGDADLTIVQTAVKLSEETEIVVVGEDTDLLVLLIYHSKESSKTIYMKSDVKVKSLKLRKVWNISKTKQVIGCQIKNVLPFLHAFTGCDSTSRINGVGKGTILKKVLTSDALHRCGKIFMEESSREAVDSAGECAFVAVFGGEDREKLDHLRYQKFVHKANVSRAVVQVQTLPPTSSAARFHSRRVYLQVQLWLDRPMNAVEWGWSRVDGKLAPLKTDLPAAPERLLTIIRCSCKVNCESKRCTCRKHGLSCSSACGECKGTSCSNIHTKDEEEEID